MLTRWVIPVYNLLGMNSNSETLGRGQRILQTLPGFPSSQCLLSSHPGKDTAIVFVHGMDGSAVGTWMDFDGLISASDDPSWDERDVYFYGYKWDGHVLRMTDALYEFVKAVFPVPNISALFRARYLSVSRKYLPDSLRDIDDAIQESELCPPKRYKRLILVGHSQGSVLIRRLVLSEAQRLTVSLETRHVVIGEERVRSAVGVELQSSTACPPGFELLISHVRLFSPASLGIGLGSFRGFFVNLLISSPVLPGYVDPAILGSHADSDLDAHSETLGLLRALQEGTESLAAQFDWSSSLKAHVAYGTDKWVGHIPPYACDPVTSYQDGKDHESVGKPTREYLFPMEFIKDAPSFRKKASA